MLDTDTKRRIDSARNILVGKVALWHRQIWGEEAPPKSSA